MSAVKSSLAVTIAALVIMSGVTTLPAAAQEGDAEAVSISLEQRMLLRCSAAFALVSNRQEGGEDWALEYPPLAQSGQEFFVRSAARVMDEAQIDAAQLDNLLREEAGQLLDDDLLEQIMPVCLRLLDQSGL